MVVTIMEETSLKAALTVLSILSLGLPSLAQEGIDPNVIAPCSYSDAYPGDKTYWLAKNRQSKTIAILQVFQSGTTILNPKGDEFPRVPKLEEMSNDDLICHFGSPRPSGNYETFDLWTQVGEPNLFHLDVRLRNRKVVGYRMRGVGISVPVWIDLSK